MEARIDRNIEVATRFLSGERICDLARLHGVSPARVRQIVKQFCRLANKQAYAAMPPGPPWPDFQWLRQHRQAFVNTPAETRQTAQKDTP